MRHFGYTMDDRIFWWRNQKLNYLVADASKSIPPQNYYNAMHAYVYAVFIPVWIAIDMLLLFFVAVLYAIDRRDSDSKAMRNEATLTLIEYNFQN